MMEGQVVILEQGGPVARVTFNRVAQLNALSPALISQTLAALEAVAESDARVLVLSGAGRSCSAGVDLKAVQQPGHDREAAKLFSRQAREIGLLLETMPQATIAQVQGHCFTGGLELALACDLIIAGEDALFCDTHAGIGLRPGWGLSQRLPRRVGLQRARELSFTGRRVTASEAVSIGLVLEAAPNADLTARVTEFAGQICKADPGAITAYKALYRASANLGLDDGLAFEAEWRRPRGSPAPALTWPSKA